MSSPINCLIIDDEPLARSLIRAFLAKKAEFSILADCINPVQAYEWLLHHDVHVIFLDIQMPVISGIEFLQSLKHPPKIIFTTAHASFAAEAFTLNAVDYIVKPVTEMRFEQALDKLKTSLGQTDQLIQPANKGSSELNYIFFKTDGKLVKVDFDEILYLEALKDYSKIFLRNGNTVLVGEHLKAVEAMLPATRFVRAHRSFLVSLQAITGVFGNTIEIGKVQLPVGGNYREQLFQQLRIK